MEDRDLIDYHFKRIYGRYPSVSERLQFKKNRPRTIYITGTDIERIRKVRDVPNWKKQSENWKRTNGLPVEEPDETIETIK
jgi:hypothetical protein